MYGYTLVMMVSGLVWGVALLKLLRHLKHHDKLMPNKKLFIMHGVVLAVSIAFLLIAVILDMTANNLKADAQQCLWGVTSIFFALSVLFTALSFWLVLYITIPITRQQRKRRMDFQTFLLNGFLDFDQLKEAVFAQNDFDDDERAIVLDDLERFGSFLERSTSSRGVVAEMVVIDPQFLAFQGNLVMRPRERVTRETINSLKSRDRSTSESSTVTRPLL